MAESEGPLDRLGNDLEATTLYLTIKISGLRDSEVILSALELPGSEARMFRLWGEETAYFI